MSQGYIVFSQRDPWPFDENAWKTHAARFFGVRVGLAEVPRSDLRAVTLLLEVGATTESRELVFRATNEGDLENVRKCEATRSTGGLYELALRCTHVCVVGVRSEPDTRALLLAAIAASYCLGPIWLPQSTEVIGAKTARIRSSSV